jgi:hypothetical protein
MRFTGDANMSVNIPFSTHSYSVKVSIAAGRNMAQTNSKETRQQADGQPGMSAKWPGSHQLHI